MKVLANSGAYVVPRSTSPKQIARDWVVSHWLDCCSRLVAAILALAGCASAAELNAGELLVVDTGGGTNRAGALFVVDPATGGRSILSDFGNPAQGVVGNTDLTGVAIGRRGKIYVGAMDSGDPLFGGGAIFAVDPLTGNRTVISNFARGAISGPLYYGLALDARGRILANLQGSVQPGVVRVNPRTDKRVIISDLSNPNQGPLLPASAVRDLALDRFGKLLITTVFGVFQVHPRTGERRLLSDFADPAQGADSLDVFFSTGLAVEHTGHILFTSGFASLFDPRNLLLRIDPETGLRTVLSDFDDSVQGPLGQALRGLAIERSGNIIVGAGDPVVGGPPNSLFRVDRKTGVRTILSDPRDLTQGTAFEAIVYVAIVTRKGSLDDD